MTENTNFLIVDDSGMPIAAMDAGLIFAAGCQLAFDLAAHCNDSTEVEHITAAVLEKYGPDAFGYIATNALGVIVKEVLAPTLEVTRSLGVDLMPGIAALARGEHPGAAPSKGER